VLPWLVTSDFVGLAKEGRMRAWVVGLVGLVFVGCGEAESVVGRVTLEGRPVQGALVFLTETPDVSMQTDGEGRFTLPAAGGSHAVTARYEEADGTFVERQQTLTAGEEAPVALPVPSRLSVKVVSDSAVELTWSASGAGDFREYKVYRGTSEGLDATTGELIFVGIARNETRFTDTGGNPGGKYVYRVFVLNDFGRLGGSNLAHASLPNVNLLRNGSFEEGPLDGAPAEWTWDGPKQGWTVSDARAHGGGRAARGTGDGDLSNDIVQRVPRERFAPNTRYRLTFSYLPEKFGTITNTYGNVIPAALWVTASFGTARILGTHVDLIESGNEWSTWSTELITPEHLEGDFSLNIYQENGASDWVLWFDEFTLQRVE
jgi:hypothetical protein